jgi:hypothetical protein
MGVAASCCMKAMTAAASPLKRSRPTAMPTSDTHSSALARSSLEGEAKKTRVCVCVKSCVKCGEAIGLLQTGQHAVPSNVPVRPPKTFKSPFAPPDPTCAPSAVR